MYLVDGKAVNDGSLEMEGAASEGTCDSVKDGAGCTVISLLKFDIRTG